jgi:hypothetical protein
MCRFGIILFTQASCEKSHVTQGEGGLKGTECGPVLLFLLNIIGSLQRAIFYQQSIYHMWQRTNFPLVRTFHCPMSFCTGLGSSPLPLLGSHDHHHHNLPNITDLIPYPEDGDSTLLWNAYISRWHYTVSHPRWLSFELCVHLWFQDLCVQLLYPSETEFNVAVICLISCCLILTKIALRSVQYCCCVILKFRIWLATACWRMSNWWTWSAACHRTSVVQDCRDGCSWGVCNELQVRWLCVHILHTRTSVT